MKAERYNSELHGEPAGTAKQYKMNYLACKILFLLVGAVFGIVGVVLWVSASIFVGAPLVGVAVIIAKREYTRFEQQSCRILTTHILHHLSPLKVNTA